MSWSIQQVNLVARNVQCTHCLLRQQAWRSVTEHDAQSLTGGHVAFQVPDLDSVVARLKAAGIRYSLTGEFAIPGMRHLYVEDHRGI